MLPGKGDFKKNRITKTLSQTVYNSLKEAVISNQLKANQRIVEKDIAKMFGISTTPVREAVLCLAAEGYLSVDSHRKTEVKKISYQELIDILQVLGELDSMAVKNAVDFMQPQHLLKLKKLTEKMEAEAKAGDIGKYLDMNTAIHQTVWNILPNKILKKTIEFVHGQLMRYTSSRISALRKPGILKKSIDDHQKILRAFENKDRKTLASLIRKNWLLQRGKEAELLTAGSQIKGGGVYTETFTEGEKR